MPGLQSSTFLRYISTILLVFVLAGCGHIAANYPVHKTPKSLLPEKFKTPYGGETNLVWLEPDRVHGFLSLWRDTSERAKTFKKLAADSGLEAHREGARMYEKLSEEGIAEAALWVFFAKEVDFRCSKGDFEVQFADGTAVRDQGVLYVEPRDVEKPYRFTRDGGLILSAEPVGKDEPLRVLLFLSAENLDKKIAKVTYMRDD